MPFDNLLLSIVVPIYNVEPYVEKCIRSLEEQDISKERFEVICVNDGSKDNSQAIVEALQQEYSNIILYNQENQGVSVARNKGIQLSKGKYLMFVDPDDFMNRVIFNQLINLAEKNDLDIIHSPLTVLKSINEEHSLSYSNNLKKVIDGVDLYYSIRNENVKFPDRCHAILFKADLIKRNDLFFKPGVPFLEDGEFMVRVSSMANRSYIYNVPYYTRLIRANSATSSDLSVQIKSLQGYILAIQNLVKFKLSNNLNSKQLGLVNDGVVKYSILSINKTLFNYKNFRWLKLQLKQNYLLNLDVKDIKPKRYQYALLFNRSISILYSKLIIDHFLKWTKIRLNR